MAGDVRIKTMKSTGRVRRLPDGINRSLALRLTYQFAKRKWALSNILWELQQKFFHNEMVNRYHLIGQMKIYYDDFAHHLYCRHHENYGCYCAPGHDG